MGQTQPDARRLPACVGLGATATVPPMATVPPPHPRPDQAEEPVDDVGASNVDLDEAHHDDHGDHPAEDPRWVLVPLLAGLVLGIVLVVVLGLDADALPFHEVF